MELVKRIYLNASNENRNREVTKGLYFRFYVIVFIKIIIVSYVLL